MYGEPSPTAVVKAPGLDQILARYRQRHPVAGEVERLAVAGFVEGEGERTQKEHLRVIGVGVTVGLVGFALSALVGLPGWVVILAVVVVVAVPMVRMVRRSMAEGNRFVALFLSDQRLLLVAPTGDHDDAVLVMERPAADVDLVVIEPIASRLVAHALVRVRFVGRAGSVTALDVARTDPVALRSLVEGSGLRFQDLTEAG